MTARGLLWRCVLLMAPVITIVGCARTLNPTQIMELNRNGKWSQAVAASRAVIREGRGQSPTAFSDASQAYFQKAYAELRLGKQREARATLADLDAFLDGRGYTAQTRWMYRETDSLRRELSLPPPVIGLKPGTRLRSGASNSVPLQLSGEVQRELAAFLRLCAETGAQGALVAKSGQVLEVWQRDSSSRLYDAGALGGVIQSAAAYRRTDGQRLTTSQPANFSSLKEQVLRPAGMDSTRIASRDDGTPDLSGPVYTTPGDLARLGLWLQELGYFRFLREHRADSPWREMRSPGGFIALGRSDTFLAVAGNLIVVRFQEPGVASSPSFQREAARLLVQLAGAR